MAYSSDGPDHTDPFPAFGPTARVLPIYVFGDSHSLGFRNTMVTDDVTGQTIAARVRFFSTTACTAQTFYSEEKSFHPELIAALEHEGLLRMGRPFHLSFNAADLKIGYSTGLPQHPPLIIIHCGDIDLRSDFLPQLKDERDFVLPDDAVYATSDLPLIPYDICAARMEARMSAVVRGVAALRAHGFVRTYLHCIVPPTTDDDLFEHVNKYRCPVNTRYKAALLCNRYLAEQCRLRGLPFIDIWPDVTSNGYLRQEFELDGVHLAPTAVPYSLRRLLQHGILHGNGVNFRRYELLYNLARGLESADNSVSTITSAPVGVPIASAPRRLLSKCKRLLKRMLSPAAWERLRSIPLMSRIAAGAEAPAQPSAPAVPKPACAPACQRPRQWDDDTPAWVRDGTASFDQDGICTVAIEPRLFQRWRSLLNYSSDVGNRTVTFDWSGNTIKPFNDNMRYAEPPQVLLDDLAQLFDGKAFNQFFQAVMGCPIMVTNVRPFLSLPHQSDGTGPQAFHRDGCPPGILRGILYLTDVSEDAGPFEYQDSAGEFHKVTAPAGTLIIVDAGRLLHRGSPPRNLQRKVLDFVFCPRLPGQPMLVIDAGVNIWPYDPFQYTLAGMKTSPPLEEAFVSLPPYDVKGLLPLRCYRPRAQAAVA